MTDSEVLRIVSRIVSDTLDLGEFELQPWMKATDVDGWDSLANVQILVAIEKALGVRFSTGEIATMTNVGDLVARTAARVAPSRERPDG